VTILLSRFQSKDLLEARERGGTSTIISLDLGLTMTEVDIGGEGVGFPGGLSLIWEEVERVHASAVGGFILEEGALKKIQIFSEYTNRLISLMPTEGAPTLLVAGFPMHRIKGIDPMQDTLVKVETIMPITGQVLDTATGLGYTAIEAARTAQKVVTIELDPAVLEVARFNPWSRSLFENPKIEQKVGDTSEEVMGFESETFTRILHDPPSFSLAGELYSLEFYRSLYRVLVRGGRLFHYVGDLNSRSGQRVLPGVIRRLEEAGFRGVQRRPEAFGVVASK
jgi:predicted methyltransferase